MHIHVHNLTIFSGNGERRYGAYCQSLHSPVILLHTVTTKYLPGKIEPQHDKTNKKTCAPRDDSDQPGHPPSLIRVFAVRMKKAWVLFKVVRDSVFNTWFLPNILRTVQWNLTKFYRCMDIDKIQVGIVAHQFSSVCDRVMALDGPCFTSEFHFLAIS